MKLHNLILLIIVFILTIKLSNGDFDLAGDIFWSNFWVGFEQLLGIIFK